MAHIANVVSLRTTDMTMFDTAAIDTLYILRFIMICKGLAAYHAVFCFFDFRVVIAFDLMLGAR